MKRIIFNCPYIHGPGAIKWIVDSWKEGFVRKGYEFHVCQNDRELATMWAGLSPQIIYCDIVSTKIEGQALRSFLAQARAAGTKVCLNVFWPLAAQPEARAEALRRFDVADLYCGEREPDSMTAFESDCGKHYVTLPQSANPRFHFPTQPDRRYAYDVVYLGAKLPHKRWFNENIILPLQKKCRLGLFGPGWTWRDNSLRVASKLARLAKFPAWARVFDRFRIPIPEEDENKLYCSSKIALNFHEREPDNSQPHHIVNQRTFKIAACGGFQIVDPVRALPRYFGEDEIVTAALEPHEWLDKTAYYLAHEEERRAIQERATARALREHMSTHRVELLERLLGVGSSS
ncbi:MAG TPA: glycosyltransferase [Candidatus Acidoferrales bacterium]|nr:glycosyltransferase [Candidatus Acidoferrales bacterium]